MLTKIMTSVAALLFVTTTAFAQDASIVSINTDKKQIEVKVGDKNHTAAVAEIELLDAEGNAAKLEDFSKGDAVKVTMEEGAITVIQLSAEDSRLLARATLSEEGSVVSINADKKQIEVKVGDKNHTVAVADVELLDSEGNAAKLDAFTKGDAVKVTLVEGAITVIQLSE